MIGVTPCNARRCSYRTVNQRGNPVQVCAPLADGTRVCIITEAQLEGLIAANHAAVKKLLGIKESNSCRYSEAVAK